MKHHQLRGLLALCLIVGVNAPAEVRYVDVNSANPTPPFTNWSTAAVTIQDAVDAADYFGDQVLVTNGIYQTGGRAVFGIMTNRVAVDKAVAIQSVNGPEFTFIQGHQVPGTTNGDGAVRCVSLTNGASLSGFTLTQGATRTAGDATFEQSGGGVWCASASVVVSNCVLTGNSAFNQGGGGYSGTLNNCILTDNSAGGGGGASGSTLSYCTLIGNSVGAYQSGGGASGSSLKYCTLTGNGASFGGGASECTLDHCVLTGNQGAGSSFFPIPFAGWGGGADRSTLDQCLLTGNSAAAGGGVSYSTLRNCTLAGNSATGQFPYNGVGGGGGASSSTLLGCTLTGNSVNQPGVGGGGGANGCTLKNCIVYFNNAPDGPNYASGFYGNSSLDYCCTTPMPTNGVGNITNAPLFLDTNGWANLRLQSNSPCINAGNNAYVTSPVDLDGKERVVGGTVDMGAYEWVAVPTHYVSLSSPNPTPPYLSWTTAATNIQDAVDAAVAGDQILVTNGVYQSGSRNWSRVEVDEAVTVQSVNGPEFTLIVGAFSIRCIYLSKGASLSGFTLTNGTASAFGVGTPLLGGGVFCSGTNEVVSNCVLVGNYADYGGGAYSATLVSCTLANNSARYAGGGAAGDRRFVFPGGRAIQIPSCRLINCTVTGNQVGGSGGGGGAYGGSVSGSPGCELINCTLTNNSAHSLGAGARNCTLNRCALSGNHGDSEAAVCALSNCTLTGGDSYGAQICTLTNCTLTGYFAGARNSTLNNCTLTRNFTGASGSRLNNCIVYYNSVADYDYEPNSFLRFCCTQVMPTNGFGNITNAPLFIDQYGGNLRLQSNSPCINSGLNAYAPAGPDLDGNPRIVGGTVDIGAYEFQSPSSFLSYAWAQQYGLPTDGSADYADSDSDLMNNWQEWIAGTVPTDASSALRLLNPSKSASGVIVTWQSVSNRTYFLERSINLGANPAFLTLATNLAGQPGTTIYTDTYANGSGPYFYRVGVQTGSNAFHFAASIIPFAWLQQYGLPTDGSADYTDPDGDGMNNWQEWIAGTVPTDASSALRLLNPIYELSGVTVNWQSVSNRTYFLERATDLGAAAPFSLLTSNIVGQAGTTSYTDTNATGPSPFFYRVGVGN